MKNSLSLTAGVSGKRFLGKGGVDSTNRNSSRDSLEIGGAGGGDWQRSRTSLERVGAILPVFSERTIILRYTEAFFKRIPERCQDKQVLNCLKTPVGNGIYGYPAPNIFGPDSQIYRATF